MADKELFKKTYPLSAIQQGILFYCLSDNGGGLYTTQIRIRLNHHVNVNLLERAWQSIIDRYEMLRASVVKDKNRSEYQFNVLNHIKFHINEVNLKSDEKTKPLKKIILEDLKIPFKLDCAPLFRISLVKMAKKEFMLLFTHHHIILGGVPAMRVVEEVFEVYDHLTAGQSFSLSHINSYESYIRYLSGLSFNKEKKYWKMLMGDFSEPLRINAKNYNHDSKHIQKSVVRWFSRKESHDIYSYVKLKNISLNTLINAAWALLLAHYTNQEDIVFGNVRELPKNILEKSLGLFINTLPLRIKIHPEMLVEDLIKQVYLQQRNLREYVNTPLQMIQNLCNLPPGCTMFETVVDYMPKSPHQYFVDLGGQWIKRDFQHISLSHYLMSLEVYNESDKIKMQVNYQSLFLKKQVCELAQHYKALLMGLLVSDNKKVIDIPLWKERELFKKLSYLLQRNDALPSDRSLQSQFKAIRKRCSSNVAVHCNKQQLTYKQLDERSNQIARELRQLCDKEQAIVAVDLERTPLTFIVILAVIKANYSYLLIDKATPKRRVSAMLRSSHPSLLITNINRKINNIRIINIVQLDKTSKLQSKKDLKIKYDNACACVIYTSGSTGEPKGVMVPSRGILELVCNTNYINISYHEVVAQISNLAFDAFTFEFWGALLNGAKLHLIDKHCVLDPVKFCKFLESGNQIDIILMTTALFNQYASSYPEVFNFFRIVLFGGEAGSIKAVNKVLACCKKRDLRLINAYGPTENSTITTTYEINKKLKSLPIGKLISGTSVLICNRFKQLAPDYVPGEMLIGGVRLALGYVGKPELFQEKFANVDMLPKKIFQNITNNSLFYKSGDIGYTDCKGNFYYQGRFDRQVKIRGYRIEIDEIEKNIINYHKVNQAYVAVSEKKPIQLVAFLIIKKGISFEMEQLHQYLKRHLPSYMVPNDFYLVDVFPLNANGKIDVKRLMRLCNNKVIEEKVVLTETEKMLLDIWKSCLGKKHIGIHDNYFSLGGDSITSIQIVATCQLKNIQITPQLIFQYPTIYELARIVSLSQKQKNNLGSTLKSAPVAPIQSWYFQQTRNKPLIFCQSCEILCANNLDKQLLRQSLLILLEQHKLLRSNFQFNLREHSWCQYIPEKNIRINFKKKEIKPKTGSVKKFLEKDILSLTKRIDIKRGDVILFRLYHDSSSCRSYLGICAHHLVMDFVSWQILLNDISELYRTGHLAGNSDSYFLYANQMKDFSCNSDTEKKYSYWKDKLDKFRKQSLVELSKFDFGVNDNQISQLNLYNCIGTVRSVFSEKQTDRISKSTHNSYNVELIDLLLVALGLTFLQNQQKGCALPLHVETHGRDLPFSNIDISRTIGWFTQITPLLLEIEDVDDLEKVILDVKEKYRQMKSNSLSYNALSFLSKKKIIRKNLELPVAVVSFNYFGQIDRFELSDNFLLKINSINFHADKNYPRHCIFEVNAFLVNKTLHVEWSYHKKFHRLKTVEILVENFHKNLIKVVQFCKISPGKYSVSDFPLANFSSQKELDKVIKRFEKYIYPNYNSKQMLSDLYPLSSLQHGILYHKLYDPGSSDYLIQCVLSIKSPVDKLLYKKAWMLVLQHYEVFRTGFVYHSLCQPLQFVLKQVNIPWSELNWKNLSLKQCHIKILNYINLDRQIGFDLAQPPLLRCCFINLAKNSYKFIFTYHHLLLDGWSFSIVIREVFKVYDMLLEKQHYKIPFSRPYKDYIHWVSCQKKQNALQYWKNLLNGFVNKVDLGFEKRVLQGVSYNSTTAEKNEIEIPKKLVKQLKKIAEVEKLTLSNIFQVILAIVLHRFSGQEDVVFGVTSSGRAEGLPGIENIVGLAINTLPMRLKINPDQGVIELIKQAQSQTIDSQKFEYTSLVDVQRVCGFHQGKELFDILYVFENYPNSYTNTGSVKVTNFDVIERTHYKAALTVILGTTFRLSLTYREAYFDSCYIEDFLEEFRILVEQFVISPKVSIRSLIASVQEHTLLKLDSWNNTYCNFNNKNNFIQEFEHNVVKAGDHTALIFKDIELSYKELNNKANQFAHFLLKQGVNQQDLISLYMARNHELIIALLAIQKIGAVYLPLNIDVPVKRLKFILNETECQYLICNKILPEELVEIDKIKVFDLSSQEIQLNLFPKTSPDIFHRDSDLAYIMYTSGSTGLPKGVLIEQGPLKNLLWSMDKEIPLTTHDRLLAISPYTFDISGLEFYWPLLKGAVLVLAEDEVVLNADTIIRYIERYNIRVMQATPITWQMMLNQRWRNKENITVICGGEQISPELSKSICRVSSKAYNVYGPTESTIWSTICDLNKVFKIDANIIGYPLANTRIYIFDKFQQLAPVGVYGELCIAGDGLAKQYIKRDDLNKQKFVDVKIYNKKERVYKTGDLACWLPNGMIKFKGRFDNQVKIHGYRIELGEIEVCLRKLSGVKDGVVVVGHSDNIENKQLTAFLVVDFSENKDINPTNIYHSLEKILPRYMIPSQYLILDSLPLTPSNKVDRKYLAKLSKNKVAQTQKYKKPQTKIERQLVDIWCNVLGLKKEQVGINDNFFILGGDSIRAIQVIVGIETELGINLSIRKLLTFSTIKELSEEIKAKKDRNVVNENEYSATSIPSSLVSLSQQGKKPIFLIHPIGGTVFCYQELAGIIGEQYTVYGLQDPGIEAKEYLFSNFIELAKSYASFIREIQPKGPYIIGGASYGGNVAIEVANQFQRLGDRVCVLSFDAWAVYPAKVNHDREWFESNLMRQNRKLREKLSGKVKIPDLLLDLQWQRQQILARYKISSGYYNLALFKSKIVSPVLRTIDQEYNHWDFYIINKIALFQVPGDHETLLEKPHVYALAEKIINYLSKEIV